MMIVAHMHAMVYTKECSLDNYRLPIILRSIYIVVIVHTIGLLIDQPRYLLGSIALKLASPAVVRRE